MSKSETTLIIDQVVRELDELDETELVQIADYIAFIRFCSRYKLIPIAN